MLFVGDIMFGWCFLDFNLEIMGIFVFNVNIVFIWFDLVCEDSIVIIIEVVVFFKVVDFLLVNFELFIMIMLIIVYLIKEFSFFFLFELL